MGKLTYINRKVEGSKLAQIVSRDIIKRIPPNLSYKAALRDPTIDFDVSGKSIEDNDLKKISEELVKAVDHRSPGRVLILEEVSLKGNKFSSQGAAAFASVIRASISDIRSLDISNNIIEIKNPQDAVAWERFLRSFGQCTALHRLDLSGNKLGQKGFEILLRVYAFEDGFVKSRESTQVAGLRSIPYICLSDTGFDDICAMYLSYILENHGLVEHLLPTRPQPKPGPQIHQLEAYHEIEGCNGIIWKPNIGIQDLGNKVLEAAETQRRSRHIQQEEDTVDTQLSQSINEIILSNLPKSSTEIRSRDDSLVSLDDSFYLGSSNITCDLVRARSRIMLDALRFGGLQQNDLWISAFRMLRYTRVILFGFNMGAAPITHTNRRPDHSIENRGRSQAFPPLPSKQICSETIKATNRTNETGLPLKSVLSRTNPNILISKKIPLVLNGTDDNLCKPPHIVTRSKVQRLRDPIQYLKPETLKQYSQQYYSNLPCGFSEEIWIDIITYASNGKGVLSDSQKVTAVGWAASRKSMVELKSVIGKHISQQIYKALEGLNCLTYDI